MTATRVQAAQEAAAEGDFERVVGLAREALLEPRLLTPTVADEPELVGWLLLLATVGEVDAARALVARVPEALTRERLATLLAPEAGGDAGGAGDAGDAGDEPTDALFFDATAVLPQGGTSDRELANAFLEWFGGRRDLYARQWYDEKKRRGGYVPVRQPLTLEVARAHLEGRTTIGQYLLFPDSSAAYGVLDLDLTAEALAAHRAVQGQDAGFLQHDALRGYARRLSDAARSLGLPLFGEDSGGKGLHLWLFLTPRRSARAVRALLAQVVTGAGAQPAEVQVELFPKQETLGPQGLSSLVKLPLGVHAQSLRRCLLLDDSLAPLEDAREALGRLRRADPAVVDAILGRRLVALPGPAEASAALELPEPLLPLPTDASPRSLAELLRGLDAAAAEAAAERMLEGCAALRAIVTRAYETRRLTAEEAKSLTYTLGLLGPRGVLVHELLAVASSSFKELERVHRGLPSPLGCKKLRVLFAQSPCAGCAMSATAQPYPSPTLLAVGEVCPAPPRHLPFAPWLDPGEDVVREPWDAVAVVLARIEQRLAALEGSRTPTSGGG